MLAFVAYERRTPDPVIDPALFRHPGFLAVVSVAFGYYFAAFGPLTVMSSWFQDGAGLDAADTSLLLALQPAVFFVVSATCGAVLQRVALWIPLGAGTALCAVGCAGFALLGVSYGPVALVPSLLLTGIGAGMVSPVLLSAAMRDADPGRAGTAAAVANTARQVGLALGTAVCGGLFVGLRAPGRREYTAAVGEAGAVAAVVALVAAVSAVVLLRRADRAGWAGRTGGMADGVRPPVPGRVRASRRPRGREGSCVRPRPHVGVRTSTAPRRPVRRSRSVRPAVPGPGAHRPRSRPSARSRGPGPASRRPG